MKQDSFLFHPFTGEKEVLRSPSLSLHLFQEWIVKGLHLDIYTCGHHMHVALILFSLKGKNSEIFGEIVIFYST